MVQAKQRPMLLFSRVIFPLYIMSFIASVTTVGAAILSDFHMITSGKH